MEDSEQAIGKNSKKEKLKIVLQWIVINFIGWILAVYLGYIYRVPVYSKYLTNPKFWDYYIILNGLVTWFPFGFWLGIMQGIYLRKWKVPFLRWVVATSFGVGVPIILCEYIDMYVGYEVAGLFYFLYLLLIGSFLGLMQYLVLKKYFERSKRWILNSTIGHFLLLFAFVGEMLLLSLYFSDAEGYGTGPFDGFMDYILIRIIPLVSFVPSIFTGLFLARNRKVEVETVVNEEVSAPGVVD